MDNREAAEAFTAMDAYGHRQQIPKCAILYSIGDGTGFIGRDIEAGELASFVYLGSLMFVAKDSINKKTKPMPLFWR